MDIHIATPAQDSSAAHALIRKIIESQDALDAQRELDDHIAALFATHTGIGAVVIDQSGHVKLFESDAGSGFTLVPGVYASIQAAIDAAADGDAIYIAAGTYREQLTIRDKQVDLLGAIGEDGASLVTLESPDVANLDVDPIDAGGELAAKCAVVRVRGDSHVTMRHLIIDGRHQGWVFRRSSPHLDFASISTVGPDTIVEYVETRGFESSEAVRLLDDLGRLKGTYSTIQAGISAAEDCDEIVIAAGLYAEDLYITGRLTLTRAGFGSEQVDGQVLIVGRVVVAASAVDVIIDGVVIDGELEMEPVAGATASVTLRNSIIVSQGASCEKRPKLPATAQRRTNQAV
jgi:hypothetical protein